MKSRTITKSACALLLLGATSADAKHGHEHLVALERKHKAHRDFHKSRAEVGESGIELRAESTGIEKRQGSCPFPSDAGLVAVTPGSMNAGWAIPPDQACTPGDFCPYACPSGQVSMQWSPDATAYEYPMSMYGGLHCDENGNIQKSLPENPYCQDGVGGLSVKNECSGVIAFCQTVCPGQEDMLIPTEVESTAELAVPGTDFWLHIAAHYYINGPGIGTGEACVWGTSDHPWGNWSPYVGGANQDETGSTFVKLAWNPEYITPGLSFSNTMPSWGVEIVCESGDCNGLPCKIDPSVNGVNEIVGASTDGAGGGAFCVVTVPQGGSAYYRIFEQGGSSSESSDSSQAPSSSAPPSSTSPSSTALSSTSAAPSTTSSSISSSLSSSSSSSSSFSSSSKSSSSSSLSWSSVSHTHTSSRASYTDAAHMLFENATSSSTSASPTQSSTLVGPASTVASVEASASAPAAATTTKTSAASTARLSIASIVMSVLVVSLTIAFSGNAVSS